MSTQPAREPSLWLVLTILAVVAVIGLFIGLMALTGGGRLL